MSYVFICKLDMILYLSERPCYINLLYYFYGQYNYCIGLIGIGGGGDLFVVVADQYYIQWLTPCCVGFQPHEDGPAFYPTVSTISLGSHTVLDFYYHLRASDDVKEFEGQGQPCTVGVQDTLCGDQTSGDKNSRCSQGSEECASDCRCSPASSRPMGGDGASGVQGGTSLDSRHFVSLLLQPRSLVLVQDDMYKAHLHGIKEVTLDTLTEKIANLDAVSEVTVGDVLERETRVSLTIRYVPKVFKSKLILGKR